MSDNEKILTALGLDEVLAQLAEEATELASQHHRIEWRVIQGNPVVRHYDRFCVRHNGNKVTLHDVTKSPNGEYLDEYCYEIVRNEGGPT